MQKDTVMEDTDSSIGVTLIHLLAKQLDANVNYKEDEEGVNGFWLILEGKFN